MSSLKYLFSICFLLVLTSGCKKEIHDDIAFVQGGVAPDKLSADGVSKNWGDVTDPSLANALKYITTGSFRETLQTQQKNKAALTAQKQLAPGNRALENHQFNGMFIERKK